MALSEITKITGPGIHTLSNVLSHNIKSSGIITATKFVGPIEGSITATDATFSGNVSIAGTLTYEDVTNIDSVGIITAPAVDVDDFLDVGSNIKLGNAGVITATSFVGSGAALTGIDATAIKDTSGNVKIQAQASGAIHSGVSTFQDLDVDGHTNLDNVSVAGVTTITDDVYFDGATAGRDITFDRSENKLHFNHNARAEFGGGSYNTQFKSDGVNFTLVHNPITAFYLYANTFQVVGAGNRSGNTYDNSLISIHNGVVKLGFELPNGGANSIDNIVTTEKGITVGTGVTIERNGQANFAGIVTFSHTGANQLVIKDSDTSGDAAHMRISFQDSGGTEKFFVGNNNSNGWLYLGSPSGQNNNIAFRVNGSDKFQVNAAGAYVNGDLTVNGTADILDSIIHTGDTDTKIRFPSNNQISFETGGSERGRFDDDGNLLVGVTGHGNAGAGARKLVLSGPSNVGLTINSTTTSGIYRDCSLYFGYGTSTADMARGQLYYSGNGDFFHMSLDGSAYTMAKSFRLSTSTARFDSTPTTTNAMSMIIKSHKSRVVNDNNGICFLDAGDHTQAVINVQKKSASNATSDLVFRTSSGQVVNTLQGIAERLRITSTGQTMIGDGTVGNSTNEKLIIQGMVTNANYEASIALRRGTTISSADAGLGYIKFQDSAGSTGASMGGRADNTWSGSSRPTHLLFYTTPSGSNSSSERMRVHSDGYVTKPYNPAFFAYGNGGRTILPQATKVQFGGVNNSTQSLNFSGNSKNSGYSTSNSRFTAPVTGTYHFTVALYFYGDNSGNICAIVPRVNGSEVHNGGDTVFIFSHDHNGANNQDGYTQNGSITLNLAANDYVEIWRRSGNTGDHYYYKNHSHFCGYLVG